MTKQEAVEALLSVLREKWQEAQEAYQKVNSSATSGELKQEGKYDTRAIEESYLAQGLAGSVKEYARAIDDLQSVAASGADSAIETSTAVRLGSLIECQRTGEIIYFLLSPSGGGTEAVVEGHEVTIITPHSPLGESLLRREVGYQSERSGLRVTGLS